MSKLENTKKPGARGALRLVPPVTADAINDAVDAITKADALPPVRRKRSNLASFFDAYADAIDRDIKALLDL
jgi:hypothetical protein